MLVSFNRGWIFLLTKFLLYFLPAYLLFYQLFTFFRKCCGWCYCVFEYIQTVFPRYFFFFQNDQWKNCWKRHCSDLWSLTPCPHRIGSEEAAAVVHRYTGGIYKQDKNKKLCLKRIYECFPKCQTVLLQKQRTTQNL